MDNKTEIISITPGRRDDLLEVHFRHNGGEGRAVLTKAFMAGRSVQEAVSARVALAEALVSEGER